MVNKNSSKVTEESTEMKEKIIGTKKKSQEEKQDEGKPKKLHPKPLNY